MVTHEIGGDGGRHRVQPFLEAICQGYAEVGLAECALPPLAPLIVSFPAPGSSRASPPSIL